VGTRNDDISLILAKAKKQGFLPDVKDEEVDILTAEARNIFTDDPSFVTAFNTLKVTNSAALKKWYMSVAQRNARQVKVAVTGNSNWEGTGATNYNERFPLALQENLRARLQPRNIIGAVVPNIHLSGSTPLPANLPYTVAGSAAGSQYGLGGRGFKLVSGTTLTIPFTGDRTIIHWNRAGGGGIINIVLDGGAPVIIDTYYNSGNLHTVWDSGALTRGAHTLVLTRDASTAGGRDIYLDDVEIFDGDYTAGIRVYDCARHGVTANGLYTSQGGWDLEYMALAPWDLVIIGLGENDTALTKAQYKIEIQGVIAWHRSKGITAPFILVHGPKPSQYGQAIWDDFRDAEREIAESDSEVAAIDLCNIIPGKSNDTLGVYAGADTTHHSSAGQAWRADLIAKILLP
jgi:lysophospholipase L1-like esterase